MAAMLLCRAGTGILESATCQFFLLCFLLCTKYVHMSSCNMLLHSGLICNRFFFFSLFFSSKSKVQALWIFLRVCYIGRELYKCLMNIKLYTFIPWFLPMAALACLCDVCLHVLLFFLHHQCFFVSVPIRIVVGRCHLYYTGIIPVAGPIMPKNTPLFGLHAQVNFPLIYLTFLWLSLVYKKSCLRMFCWYQPWNEGAFFSTHDYYVYVLWWNDPFIRSKQFIWKSCHFTQVFLS